MDPERFRPEGRSRSGILSVGALDESKDPEFAVAAVAKIPKAARPPLTIIYEREQPRMHQRLTKTAARSGVDLRLKRGVTDEVLAEHYRSAAVTLLTARLEPFGLATLESMASGTPVVAVAEGGFRESVISGVNGYLAERDPRTVAARLADVLQPGVEFDPESVRATVIPFFSWAAAAARFDHLVASAAGRTEQGPT